MKHKVSFYLTLTRLVISTNNAYELEIIILVNENFSCTPIRPLHWLCLFQRYKADGHHTIVLAGEEYGSGSSRDWAAKGPMLLVYACHTTVVFFAGYYKFARIF
jgi:hypothetical protein